MQCSDRPAEPYVHDEPAARYYDEGYRDALSAVAQMLFDAGHGDMAMKVAHIEIPPNRQFGTETTK